MNYTVIWRPRAERLLAALWAQATDQQALADAAESVDRILRRDPGGQGESRDPGWRLWFDRPLAVLYRVDEPTRTVYVAAIKRAGR